MVRGIVYPKYRSDGRFFGRRANCEYVPLLPGWIVSRVLDDPRRIPYLLVWKSRSDGTVQEAVRIAPYSETDRLGGLDWTGAVEIKRHDGTRNFIRTLLRPLPRNGGKARLLVCPYCQISRRGLYGWEPGGQYTTSVESCSWRCRKCASLRYSSEGGALRLRGRGNFFRLLEMEYGSQSSPRPDVWYPEVYTSREQMAEAGFCDNSGDE